VNRIAIAGWFILTLFVAACQSSKQVFISTETPILTSTPLLYDTPTPTTTKLITPKITATPILANINTDDDLKHLVKQLYPFPCIGYNYAKAPVSDVNHASKLNFIEVDIHPDQKQYWVSEIADNIDGNRQAFVACKPELCQDKIYVQDDKSQKVYEIDWEARMPWRPIQWITWINNDTLAFLQSANPDHASIIVINFERKEVLYQAVIYPDYACTTPTPIP